MDGTTPNNIRALTWNGSIPITLTLAPSSLSSPTMPPPQHHLVSRHTYLHIGLQEAILRLFKFGPPSVITNTTITTSKTETDDKEQDNILNDGGGNSELPQCWFEDEETGTPLRWHLFVGVLFDILAQRRKKINAAGSCLLPWKIRLHFMSYPTHQILSLGGGEGESDVSKTIQRNYSNSLKQALFLQHGSSKVAMNLTKSNHNQIWDALVRSNYDAFWQVSQDLLARPSSDSAAVGLKMIPVRIMVDSKPAIQQVFRLDDDAGELTLASLLSCWINEKEDMVVGWAIQGVQPPLNSLVLDLWQALCYPDHFLYITISMG